jgi:hypothetical protein
LCVSFNHYFAYIIYHEKALDVTDWANNVYNDGAQNSTFSSSLSMTQNSFTNAEIRTKEKMRLSPVRPTKNSSSSFTGNANINRIPPFPKNKPPPPQPPPLPSHSSGPSSYFDDLSYENPPPYDYGLDADFNPTSSLNNNNYGAKEKRKT